VRYTGAGYVYPHLGVPELDPPTSTKTSWDFSLIDPVTEDVMKAVEGHPVVLNFTTIPARMFKGESVAYPEDLRKQAWHYAQGRELRDPTYRKENGEKLLPARRMRPFPAKSLTGRLPVDRLRPGGTAAFDGVRMTNRPSPGSQRIMPAVRRHFDHCFPILVLGGCQESESCLTHTLLVGRCASVAVEYQTAVLNKCFNPDQAGESSQGTLDEHTKIVGTKLRSP